MSDSVNFSPFPTPGARGPQVCASVRFYLALIDDLTLEQTRVLSAHLQECPACAAEYQRLSQVTQLVASLPESEPSARVDEAIRAAIARRGDEAWAGANRGTSGTRLFHPPDAVGPALHADERWREREQAGRQVELKISTDARILTTGAAGAPRRHRAGVLVLVAALLLALLAGALWRGLIWPGYTPAAFQLPANLSWNGYVMHYTQTRFDTQGHSYQVEVYQDLGTNQMHIESSMPGKFDVVVVATPTEMLGKDMMNHVAQTGQGVEGWAVDGSLFDLEHLRQDLASKRAAYLGKSTFKGQPVYQVQMSNGQVLLLDMNYLPVGALHSPGSPNAGQPLYNSCQLMPAAQVSDSMWDMSIPPGFQMGALPEIS